MLAEAYRGDGRQYMRWYRRAWFGGVTERADGEGHRHARSGAGGAFAPRIGDRVSLRADGVVVWERRNERA